MLDKDYNFLDIKYHNCKNYINDIEKPKNLDKMINFCNDFCKKIKLEFVRIDLYEINDKIYFGEFTFTPNACRAKFSNNFDYKFYKLLKNL